MPLAHGRRLSVVPNAEGDILHVRSREGSVELSIALGRDGAKVRLCAVDLELVGTRALTLEAQRVSVKSHDSLDLVAAGDMRVDVSGQRHTTVQGADRTEAFTIESQANEGELILRARGDVRVDGEHIGLNDDPCPGPLAWTTAATHPREEV